MEEALKRVAGAAAVLIIVNVVTVVASELYVNHLVKKANKRMESEEEA